MPLTPLSLDPRSSGYTGLSRSASGRQFHQMSPTPKVRQSHFSTSVGEGFLVNRAQVGPPEPSCQVMPKSGSVLIWILAVAALLGVNVVRHREIPRDNPLRAYWT
jgi:hypothetical protein